MAEVAIEVKNLSIEYRALKNISVMKTLFHGNGNNKQDKAFRAVNDVSFRVAQGEILGIIGKNGSGKSTMLRAIAGIFRPDEGIIDLKDHSVSLMSIGVGFNNEMTGRQNIILSGMLLGFSEEEMWNRMEEIIAFAEIGHFIDMPVKTYSSGMHSKLAFAITASLETDIILVDEVLSVGDEKFKKKSLAKMKELINDQNRTVLIVSHDLNTLNQLCDRILWIHDGKIREVGEPKVIIERYREFMRR